MVAGDEMRGQRSRFFLGGKPAAVFGYLQREHFVAELVRQAAFFTGELGRLFRGLGERLFNWGRIAGDFITAVEHELEAGIKFAKIVQAQGIQNGGVISRRQTAGGKSLAVVQDVRGVCAEQLRLFGIEEFIFTAEGKQLRSSEHFRSEKNEATGWVTFAARRFFEIGDDLFEPRRQRVIVFILLVAHFS